MKIVCSQCGQGYPSAGVPYRCDLCGGVYDFRDPITFEPQSVDHTQPGIWKYRAAFAGLDDLEPLTLGEGDTGLLWTELSGRRVAFKCEYANPTGSFKDRGMATLVACLRSRGVMHAVEDSSGNAGASFGAYAARAGMRAQVFVPEAAAGPKRDQIQMYGAELTTVAGARDAATAAARRAALDGKVYASHAWLPFNLPGYATTAFELAEQLDGKIGAVVIPVGQGGLLLGMARGFEALHRAKVIPGIPKLIGVQAEACAPMIALAADRPPSNPTMTIAEGVQVAEPVRKTEIVRAIKQSGGLWVTAPEDAILTARDELAQRGFYVEPTSALVWSALINHLKGLPDPVVAVLTGSGYKVRQ